MSESPVAQLLKMKSHVFLRTNTKNIPNNENIVHIKVLRQAYTNTDLFRHGSVLQW